MVETNEFIVSVDGDVFVLNLRLTYEVWVVHYIGNNNGRNDGEDTVEVGYHCLSAVGTIVRPAMKSSYHKASATNRPGGYSA